MTNENHIHLTSTDIISSAERTRPYMTLDSNGMVHYWASVVVGHDKAEPIQKEVELSSEAYRALLETRKLHVLDEINDLLDHVDMKGFGTMLDVLIHRHTG